jgi:hypothetical protein
MALIGAKHTTIEDLRAQQGTKYVFGGKGITCVISRLTSSEAIPHVSRRNQRLAVLSDVLQPDNKNPATETSAFA